MRKFAITKNYSENAPVWGAASELPLNKWLELFGSHDRRPHKSGPCYIAGALSGPKRGNKHVVRVDALVYDIDRGQTHADIDAILSNLPVVCVVHSSHNHGKTKTSIATDLFEKTVKRYRLGDPEAPTKEMIQAFCDIREMQLKVTYFDRADRSCWVRGSDGLSLVFQHEETTKLRVIFPLKEPFYPDAFSTAPSKALAEFKSIYIGVGRALGFNFDEACEDLARVFYFPSCPEGTTPICDFWGLPAGFDFDNPPADWAPNLLDFNDYPRAYSKTPTNRPDEKGNDRELQPSDFRVVDTEGRMLDLLAWNKNNYDYDILDLLERTLPPEMLRKERDKGGRYVQCPYEEDNHTDMGEKGENDTGTFADNGSADMPWNIFCSHTSCLKVHNRRKLDYLAEYIRKGHILVRDIVGEQEQQPSDPLSPDNVADILNIDPKTLPKKFNKRDEEGEEDDETSDLTDYIEEAYSGDEEKDAFTVYEECLGSIKRATTFSEAMRALDRIKDKKCEIDESELKETLAVSRLGATILKKIFKFLSARIQYFVPEEWFEYIKAYRDNPQERTEMFRTIRESRKVGQELRDCKKEVAEYYLLDYKVVQAFYEEFESNIVNTEYGPIFAEHKRDFDRRYVRLKVGNGVFYVDVVRSAETGAPDLYTSAALKEWNCGRLYEVTRTKNDKLLVEKKQSINTWMKESSEIGMYHGVTYVPKGKKEENGLLNLWSEEHQFEVVPKPGDVSLILNHLKDVWCNGDEALFNWTLLWFADIIQNPERRPMTALLILGEQGTGKSIIFDELMAYILGRFRQFGKSAKRDDVVGRFNAELTGKLLWLSEESLFAGDKSSMQILKDAITSPTVLVEKKGMEKFPYPSYTRFVFTSNMMHALHLEESDRRFAVYRATNKYKQNIPYFEAMREWCENGGRQFWLDYLLKFKPEDVGLTWADLKKAPITEAKKEQILMSYDIADMFFLDLLRNGKITEGAQFLDGVNVSWPLHEEGVINPKTLQDCYNIYVARCGGNQRHDRPKFKGNMRKYIFGGENSSEHSKVVRIEGRLTRVFKVPPREKAIIRAIENNQLMDEDLVNARSMPNSHMPDTITSL